MKSLLLGGLLVATPVWALQCGQGQTTVQQVVVPSRSTTQTLLECRLDRTPALMLHGWADSALVRARGALDLVFLDAAGREVEKQSLPALVGQFRNLELGRVVRVPDAATQVRVVARIDSKSPEGTGRLSWRDLRLDATGAVDIDVTGDGVISGTQPLVVTLKGSGWPAQTPWLLRVLDLEGREVRRLQGLPADGRWTLPPLPVGYYDVRLEAGRALPMPLQQPLAVIPAGEPPRERRMGLDTALSWYGGEGDTLRRQMSLMRLAGVGSVRDRFSWSQVQKQQGTSQWGRYAEVARQLQQSGFDVVQVFHDAPQWARLPGAAPSVDRAAPSADAAWALGQAYARGLGPWARQVEFWNEENSPFFVGYPFEYAAALKAFRAGIHSVDPGITVLLGAAAGRPGPFFDELARNQVATAIDRGNQHFYGKVEDLLALAGRDPASSGQARWLTEIGYSLKRDANGDWRRAEREQSTHLVKAMSLGLAAGYERVFYFLLRELIEDDFHTWGIVHNDLGPRPAFVALSCLTRHLEGAVPVALQQQGGVSAVYFRKASGELRAVAWGRGAARAVGAARSVSDSWCRPLAAGAAQPDEPVLLTAVARLPAQARALPKAPAAGDTGLLPVRLSAELDVDGVAPPRTGNAPVLAVSPDQQLQWTGRVLRDGGPAAPAVLECRAGPGVQIVPPARLELTADAVNGARWNCRYRIESVSGASWIEAALQSGTARDVVHLALQSDLRRKARQLAAARPLQPLDVCGRWDHNAAPTVRLDIKVQRGPDGCRGLDVRSEIIKSGESWVFPGTPMTAGRLARVEGVRLQVAAVGDTALPPRPFMLQLVEKNGAIWLVELHRDEGSAPATWTGLFDGARPAAWAPDPDGRFDPERVTRLMLGWGGYGGQTGQVHAYRLESLLLIPASRPEKPVHAADS